MRNFFLEVGEKGVSAKMHHDTSIGQLYRLCADGDGSGPLHEGSHDGDVMLETAKSRRKELKIFHITICHIFKKVEFLKPIDLDLAS